MENSTLFWSIVFFVALCTNWVFFVKYFTGTDYDVEGGSFWFIASLVLTAIMILVFCLEVLPHFNNWLNAL